MKNKFFIITAMIILLFSLFIACTDYGEKLEIDGDEIYYISENVEKEEAQKLGEFLQSTEYFTGEGFSVQLDKKDDVYLVRFVVQEEAYEGDDYTDLFRAYGEQISNTVLNGEAVEVHLCDDTLTTKKVID
jgi:hypothetical protein